MTIRVKIVSSPAIEPDYFGREGEIVKESKGQFLVILDGEDQPLWFPYQETEVIENG